MIKQVVKIRRSCVCVCVSKARVVRNLDTKAIFVRTLSVKQLFSCKLCLGKYRGDDDAMHFTVFATYFQGYSTFRLIFSSLSTHM